MSRLLTLFKDSETRLGVFYPKDYVVAIFRSFESARAAFQALRRAGFTEDDAMAVPGSDVLEYLEEVRETSGVWGTLMTEFSRLIGTEAQFLDDDIEAAKRGAGFLVVHCNTEELAGKIRALVAPCQPMSMQWYMGGAIRLLV